LLDMGFVGVLVVFVAPHSLGPCRAFLPWSSGCIDSVSQSFKKRKKGVVLTMNILHSPFSDGINPFTKIQFGFF
jgi:hypothetical protein